MELFQCFVCYLLGFGILMVLNSFFKTSEKLYYRTVISSAIGGVFLFIFAVVGYKFAVIDGLSSNGGTNVLVIEDHKASITEADCPDKLCIHQGQIWGAGQMIVCLPNRLTVTIEGVSSGVDIVVN